MGSSPSSRFFHLRSKGELEEAARALAFERASVFRPSMILTPTYRYGMSQAVVLAVWPALSRLMVGRGRAYRGIRIAALGRAIAHNLRRAGPAFEALEWPEITELASAT